MGVVIVLVLIGILSLSMVVFNATEGVGIVRVETSSDGAFALYYDNVTVHDGDIVINGTQTVVIENCNFTQNGAISITDMGKLIITNSTLVLFGHIRLKDNANMTVVDSTFENPFPMGSYYQIELRGSSTTVIHDSYAWEPFHFDEYDNSSLFLSGNNTSIYDLDCNSYSSVSISDHAYLGDLIAQGFCSASISNGSRLSNLYMSASSGDISVSDLRAGFPMSAYLRGSGQSPDITISDSTVRSISLFWRDCHFQINECVSDYPWSTIGLAATNSSGTIRNSSLDVDLWTPSQAYIENCNLAQLGFDLLSANATFENLVPGYYDYWNVYTNASVATSPSYLNNITLSACQIQKWWINVDDANISVSSSQLYFLGTEGILSGVCNFSVRNTSILEMAPMGFSNVDFDNATVEYWYVAPSSSTYVFGNVTFGLVSYFGTASVITRCYSVVVLANETQPVSEANLTLYASSEVVWSGLTDETGQAFFNVTFTADNYAMVLTLETTKEQFTVTQNITLLSATPVIVEFQVQGDVNSDGIVDIFDAILLANAFNSIPVSPTWNPDADINSNGTVDIFDAIILANHYNQHYP